MLWNSIADLKKEAEQSAVHGAVWAQLTQKVDKVTKTGKPYLDLSFADTSSTFSLKIWDNADCYHSCNQLEKGASVELTASWQLGSYGMEAAQLHMRPLSEQEEQTLLAGAPELMEKQQRDWADIQRLVMGITDPRLQYLCRALLDTFEDRFRRCAAARNFHHARRGGLVEHVSAIMRAGKALCSVYPEVNEDLLMAGILFHDCGKMWENQYEEAGFSMPHSEVAELLGHIPIGIEMINKLWNFLLTPERRQEWSQLEPASDRVRLHLIHLVAAHHGELEYGSPVVPKTPEAMLLHYLDNIDAKLEMFRDAYANSPELAPRVHQRRAPLNGNEVTPLPRVQKREAAPPPPTAES